MLLAKSMPRKFMYPKNRKAQVIMASSPAYTSQPATLYRYPTSNTPGSKARLRRASAVPLAAQAKLVSRAGSGFFWLSRYC